MEYHKIETLFDRDEKTFKVYPDRLKNPVYGIFKIKLKTKDFA